AGFVHERLGEYGPAMRYYDEALQERPFQGLRAPIQRLAAETPVRGERVKALLGEQGYAPVTGPSSQPVPTDTSTPPTEAAPVEPAPSDAPPPTATLAAPTPTRATLPALAGPPTEILVFVNLGRVPYKIPQRLPIGLAVGLAGTYITGDIRVLEHTAFKFVNYPKLVSADNDYTRGSVTIDGAAVPLELASNLEAEVAAEYEELLPKIIGAAITRMITRAIAAEGARAAGRQSEGAGALVGFLAAAVTEGALTAADKPDTRSWTMLPAQVYIARAAVTPGKHAVVVDVGGPGGRENRRYDVDVSSGGFVVLDITTLR
ncbi:MAG: hypothetical protein KC636_10895, partial [Myxococcales bacterium]|nr:hypothetical protein [Myxococcales bacterium]